jgi:hypothetical protein
VAYLLVAVQITEEDLVVVERKHLDEHIMVAVRRRKR